VKEDEKCRDGQLHLAEKVNVEKLPVGAYWAVSLGPRLHLQSALVNAQVRTECPRVRKVQSRQ
jgi:hypothetical protein